MAPILPPFPPSTASVIAESAPTDNDISNNTRSTEIAKKKKQLKQKKSSSAVNHDEEVKQSPTKKIKEDVTSKPLPQLIQQVLKAMELEEERLKKEEATLLEARMNKAPAATLQNLSPLDSSVPPLPPPKDPVESAPPAAAALEVAKEPVIVEEKPLPEIIPERLSLEEDYPNRTINPEEIITKEYRKRQLMQRSNQWYFDEYSGLYRQNASASNLHQSLPNFHKAVGSPELSSSRTNSPRTSTTDHHTKNMAEKLLRSNSSTFYNNRPPSLACRLQFSKLFEDHNNSSATAAEENEEEDWPTPTSIEQVHELKRKARSMRDRRKQLDLCRLLMDTACKGETDTTFVNASPIPGTPPVHTRYRQQELRKKKKKDLMLNQVLVLEAQKILKRLVMSINSSDSGDAQFLLANCYGVGGLGLPLDRERAFALYIHASKQNHAESTYRAGVCYEIGVGTRKDIGRAMLFYRKAATLSHVASMYKLGIILLRGYYGQVKNTREAITWLQRAAALASLQHPHAVHALALFQLCQQEPQDQEVGGTNMIADPAYALELLHESATQWGYVPSQVKLGELYETGAAVVEVDDALSIYWYTKAAEQGNADAALALSSWYLTGSWGILDQSDREAYLWARKAAACQYADRWTIAKAYFLVGMYAHRGIGVGVNNNDGQQEDARIWFKRSTALGHKGAMEMLDKCSNNSNNTPNMVNDEIEQQREEVV